MTIQLGSRVRDKITGFEGIVTTTQKHITGCDTCWVQPSDLDKDGKVREPQSFDVLRLDVLSGPTIDVAPPKPAGTVSGG